MLQNIKDQAVAAIRRSYQVLSTEQDLSPRNDRVTHSLTHLVHMLTQCQSGELTQFLLDARELSAERKNLPDLCGMAECEMEKYWAGQLLSRAHDLEQFWYYAQYCELCRAEVSLLGDRTFGHIGFLGSGALPLTAFLLAQHYPLAQVSCVDFDAEACTLSEKLIATMGLQSRMRVQCLDAREYAPQEKELIVCASLLRGGKGIYQRLSAYDCALIVRDAEGPYQYLYKAAELPGAGFRPVAKTAVSASRINTSRYYERDAEVFARAG